MNLNEQAALVIRSLMRDLRVSDHIVTPRGGKSVSSASVLEQLEAPHVGDGTSDAALAIGEHAFRTGYKSAADRARAFHPTRIEDDAAHMEQAWSDYDPPEDIKALA